MDFLFKIYLFNWGFYIMDTISNTLTLIRNANLSRHEEVILPFLKMNLQLINILKMEGFIDTFYVNTHLHVRLKYKGTNRIPVLTNLKRLSTPGRRIYIQSKQIPQLFGGLGLIVLSTSKGILSHKQAKYLNLGGELLCSIW